MRVDTTGIVVLAYLLSGIKKGKARLLERDCGIRSESLFPLIAGGTTTSIYENPWMVRVFIKEGDLFQCGGSLITSRFVLTAAHCISDAYIYVKLGDYLTVDPEPVCSSGVCIPIAYIINVDKKIPHEHYNKELNSRFDIALLRMVSEVTFSAFVSPICLLVDEQMEDLIKSFNVTGWGFTENQELSQRLLSATVYKSERWYCEGTYKTLTDKSQICAGSETSRTCIGDSGGPLTAERTYGGTQRVFQYGLVSLGSQSCITRGTFEVYTKVPYYMEWIMDRIKAFKSFPSDVVIGTNKLTASPNDEICGTTKRHSRARRIVGGYDAERFANPWMVMVFSKNNFICGGSLVTPRFVMTSAHCSSESKILDKVRLGGYHMNITENTIDININRIITHPQYGLNGKKYDIALLQMAQKVSFSDYIRPICLPVNVNQQLGTISRFEAHGWGFTKIEYSHPSGYLQSTILNNLGLSYCNSFFVDKLDQSQICAGSNTSDTCYGDGGGPLSAELFNKGTNRVFQFGIGSYGSVSCDYAGVYTNVMHYLNWIKDTIDEN